MIARVGGGETATVQARTSEGVRYRPRQVDEHRLTRIVEELMLTTAAVARNGTTEPANGAGGRTKPE